MGTLTKEVVADKIEVIGDFKVVHCREVLVVKEDGVIISRGSYDRHILNPSSIVTNNDTKKITHRDTDISGEPAETQAICNAVWTDDIKAAWQTHQKTKFMADPGHSAADGWS